jgi:CBS domain-containing protein
MSKKVKDAMHKGAECMPPEASLSALAQCMQQHDIGMIAITDKDKLLGILTDRDIVVRGLVNGRDPSALKARDVMTANVVSCEPSDGLKRAAHMMAKAKVRRLPVVSDGKVIGTLSIGDLSQADGSDDEMILDMLKSVCDHHA